MITGEQVKAARKLVGWSQTRLGGHVGVSDVAISNIERAAEWPPNGYSAAYRKLLRPPVLNSLTASQEPA
jgi:transcriptional regulator with XRE-family HTH domain